MLILGAGAFIGSAVGSRAASVVNNTWTFEGADWGSSDWSLVGNASWANEAHPVPHRMRMTDNGSGEVGSSWLNTATVDATASWSFSMRGQFMSPIGGGADAMSVGFQSSGLTQNGFWGATHSLQITLDSYQNAGDPYASTLKVSTSGGGVIGTLDLVGALESTYYFNMWASYDANTHKIDVTFKNDLADAVNGSWTVDLSNEFSTDAYYGFSGWTGAASEKHDVLSTTLNAVPEPSTFALLVAGVGGVLLRRRARA